MMLYFRIVFIFFLTLNLFSAPDVKQISKDWEELDRFLEESNLFLYESEMEKNTSTFVEKWLSFSENFSKVKENFLKKYGSDRNLLIKNLENIPKPLNAKRESYQIINEIFSIDVNEIKTRISGWASDKGKENFRGWEELKNSPPEKIELKLSRAERALKYFQTAQKLNKDSDYEDLIKKAEKAVNETKPEYKKRLSEIKWPGHNKNFKGPNNSNELAKKALEFLQNNPTWSKPEYDDVHIPYAACVEGSSWEVWKKAPLTNQPTQYSLDMLVAFKGSIDKEIAYVYRMTFYTEEKAGVKEELPFKYASSKQYAKYKMLISNIPYKSCSVSSKSCKTGFFGILWGLLFALTLICSGSLLAKELVCKKIPKLNDYINHLEKNAKFLGMAIGVISSLSLFINIIKLSPFASILPQIAGIFAAIVILRRTEKWEFLNKFAVVDGYFKEIGMLSISLGFLHLLLGCLVLF